MFAAWTDDIGVAINQFNARNSRLFFDGAYFRMAISAKVDPFLDSVKASHVKILPDEFDSAFNTGGLRNEKSIVVESILFKL